MKKINKKFLIGFLFVFVFGIILVLPSIIRAVDISVSVTADDTSLSYPNSGTTIRWSSSGADSCRGDEGQTGSFGTGSLSVGTHTYSVTCTKTDPPVVCNSYYLPLVSCFTADTKVILSDGSIKNIQDVKVGDVLKGEKTNNKVLGLHQPELNGKLYSFNGGRYFVTEEHPFKTIDGWKSINPEKTALENIGIEVSPLDVGDTLITENGNILLKTIDSKEGKVGTDLFNFILDGDHTYYADGYLVHNKTACGSGYTCAGSGVCMGATGYCGTPADRKVAGSYLGDQVPGPYEGTLCRDFGDEGSCEQGWATHGCSWYGGSPTCAPCPGSCPSGYTASCSGSQTYCVENQPCVGA